MSLDELKSNRKNIKSSITRHQNAVASFKEGDNVASLEVRLTNLTELFKQYNSVQSEIEELQLANKSLDETVLESENNKERDKVESQYFEVVGTIKSILNKNKPSSSSQDKSNLTQTVFNITSKVEQTEQATNLKPLPLPNFNGKHSEWFTFYDSFESLVHNDPNISNIRKFHYLRSCLKDEAFRAIESLAVSSANYESALNTLKSRFENKRLIVNEHVTNILNIQQITKSCHSELRQLLDVVNNNLEALKVWKVPIEKWDSLLIPILLDKLDYNTKKEWQTTLGKELPTYESFKNFMDKRCQVLESLNVLKPSNTFTHQKQNSVKQVNNNFNPKRQNKLVSNIVQKSVCVVCKKSHNIFQCNDFLSKVISDRIKQAENLKLCLNCLRNNHSTNNCKSTTLCKECGQRHHTLLHIKEFVPPTDITLHAGIRSSHILLSTVKILIMDKHGNWQSCRALLDQGSQANIITEQLHKNLNLKCNSAKTFISGINASVNQTTKNVDIVIKSRYNNFTANLNCLILPKITELTPCISFDKTILEIPNNIVLADPNFNESREIDLLIGAEWFWNLLIGSPVQTRKGQPHLQNTKLGWIVGGNITIPKQNINVSCNLITLNSQTKINLESQVERFWKQEEVLDTPVWSLEQINCEQHFVNNTIRDPSGRFIVKLPFKDPGNLGDSYGIALKRFLNLEQKFKKDPQLKLLYKEFMAEYLTLNHMEPVPASELKFPSSNYLPHHPVFKNTIEGPKIRVVFDASAKTSNGLSLNDNLMTGPTIQQDLFSILTRFRTYKFVVSADITKMYRMILVHPTERNFQRILWREDPNKAIEIFRLNTVTYGTTCAPFLAVRSLQQLALDYQQTHPIASNVIKRDFYMDDLLTGSNSLDELNKIKNEVSFILNSGGFNLCKWASNNPNLFQASNNSNTVNFEKTNEVKVLGFVWNCKNDLLKYNVNSSVINQQNQNVTKRFILSAVAQIFDPLGLINPIIVKAKILLQNIWCLKLGWDQTVPDKIKTEWLKIVSEFDELKHYKISRSVISFFPYITIELHGFSDASIKAYGACIYLRIIDSSGNVAINLLCAKSRVAPLKTISLPRLELNAAVLLVKLANKLLETLNIQINKKYFWTDSTIVLAWLAESPINWKQYVGHRVAEIQNTTSYNDWYHVRSGDNPADIVSRGTSPKQLKQNDLWWHGPEFLRINNTEFVESRDSSTLDQSLLERKPQTSVNIVKIEEELPVMTKYSSFNKLKRVIAYCFRFRNNAKGPTRNLKALTVEELNNSTMAIIRYIQGRNLSDELKQIEKFSKISKSNKLTKLDPFIDSNGVLRVGGRLKHAPINYDNKFPIILPEKHHITKLIIQHYHKTELHAGNEATLAAVRQRYWPISARNLIRKVIHSCIVCTRAKPKLADQKMGDLPSSRLQPIRPFLVSGVDYAGPFLIKEGRSRGMRKVKGYIALFVCFATKAVHLELVGNLTSESFVASLKRFIARRGHVKEIYCDNGTNFVGAEKELIQSQNFYNKINNELTEKGIKFHFIPARSPHFGGLWERAVRSTKHHLKRVVGDASLNYEEFYTLLTCIEACLNSRPLTPLSQDPNDLDALTPGHFLIGAPLTAPVESDLTSIQPTRLSRWQRIQQLQQHFWQRWQREYLSQLQERPKGQQFPQENIKPGTMVVLVEENLPPLKWKLGRVINIHPGEDGVVRVVTVKTASGLLKRSVKKVAVLPVDNDNM